MLSHDSISKKPLLLFKSFTGITIQEFYNIYNNEITKIDIVNTRSNVYPKE
ncbi:MAG TPA: hypothetical protein VIY08_01950 [Candidatus Nitrosocosmicus sp.]